MPATVIIGWKSREWLFQKWGQRFIPGNNKVRKKMRRYLKASTFDHGNILLYNVVSLARKLSWFGSVSRWNFLRYCSSGFTANKMLLLVSFSRLCIVFVFVLNDNPGENWVNLVSNLAKKCIIKKVWTRKSRLERSRCESKLPRRRSKGKKNGNGIFNAKFVIFFGVNFPRINLSIISNQKSREREKKNGKAKKYSLRNESNFYFDDNPRKWWKNDLLAEKSFQIKSRMKMSNRTRAVLLPNILSLFLPVMNGTWSSPGSVCVN